MADSIHTYGQIWLGSRGGMSQGQLKINNAGFQWRRANGGNKTVEIKKDDIDGLVWSKNSRGCQLGVRVRDGPTTNFQGFREKDLEALKDFSSKQFGFDITEQAMSTSGRNWGALAINGGNLMFLVDGKVAFEVPLRDVAQAQQVKDDVMLEFHVDDTAGGDEKEDMLTEMALHVPPTNEDFPALNETDGNSAKVLLDRVLQHTETDGMAASDESVCIFGEVGVLAPRGRFEVEMHLGYFSLTGQTQDFKIRYTSIQRIFILPKLNTPHTLVVVSLDPPIRKGQTYYTHVLCQFPSDMDETVELDISDDQLAAKNEKNGGKLERSISGPIFDVFARALRGLSGAKITRPGAFRSAQAPEGHSIRCSYKADDGHLYPLERAFFYVHKPPLLVPFEEIESVEFARQGGGVVSSRTFDLIVRMRNEAEHQFRNISREEWQNLFEFITAKKIRVENLASAQQGPGGPGKGLDIGDDMDAGLRRAAAELDDDEDEDEDFDGGSGGSESTDDEDEDSSDAEIVEEEGITLDGKKKRKRDDDDGDSEGEGEEEDEEKEAKPKKAKADKPPPKKRAPKEKEEGGGAGQKEGGKKPRKKKDPNAPKGALSAFMYFSQDRRQAAKDANPAATFGELGKILGEQWKAIGPEDKAKYEAQAAADKERYTKAMAAYKGGAGGAAAAAGGDASGDEEGGDDE